MSLILYLRYLTSVFLSSIIDFYDDLGVSVSPFDFFGVQDVIPVK